MLVSHSKKFIFLKSKKTAGTSVREYFLKYCISPESEITRHMPETFTEFGITSAKGEYANVFNKTQGEHIPSVKLKLLLDNIDVNIWKTYYKFSIIRNPYNIVISAFFYYGLTRRPLLFPMFSMQAQIQAFNDPIPENIKTYFRIWVKHELPFIHLNSDYIFKIGTDIVPDFFIKLETINDDMEILCNKLNIKWEPDTFSKFNIGHNKPNWVTAEILYDDESIQLVKELFSFQLEHFNYDFPK